MKRENELIEIINNSKAGSRDAKLNLIKSNMELEEWDTTVAMLSGALSDNPDDIEFNLMNGRILLRTGRNNEAIDYFKNFRLEPERIDIPIFWLER